MKPDFQRIQSLLREAVTMLCKNSLPYKQELCVEGLLGITLDKEDIFLVNIKEILKPHEIISSVDDSDGGGRLVARERSDDSRLVVEERSLSPANYNQEERDNGESNVECGAVSTRAVVPIFKAPNKVQRSHKRAVSNTELSHHWFTSLTHRGSGDPHTEGWEDGGATPPHNKRHHPAPSHHVNSPAQTIDIDSLPVMEVKKEALDDCVMANYQFHQSADNLSELTNYPSVCRGEAEVKHILPVSLPSIAGLTSSSWHLGSGDVLSTSMPTLPNLSSDMVSAGLPSSHFSNSLNSQPDAASTGSDVPLDPELLNKIQAAVLKDEGCFITSRMLCRRYSALFKVHHVVQAMQAMVLPPDDERHIGVFKFINERTKVFYKCPPCAIRPAALAAFGVTPAQYRQNYYRLPRNKSMKTDNWAVFVEHILRCNPYGPVNMPDFLSAGSPGSLSVHEPAVNAGGTSATQSVAQATTSTPTMSGDSEKTEPVDTYDEFDIQCAVVQTDGCFASSRSLCRKNTYRVVNVIRAMTAMSRPRGHPLYVGTYVRVSERVKVFYKCPPHLVSAEALRLYGIEAGSYAHFYRRNPRPPERAMLNWTGYVEGIIRKWPFDAALVPFESFQLPDVDVFRLRSVVGVDAPPVEALPLEARPVVARPVDDHQPAVFSHAGRYTDLESSVDAKDTATKSVSLDTAEVSTLSLADEVVTVSDSVDRSPARSPASPRGTEEGGDGGGGGDSGVQRQKDGKEEVHEMSQLQ